MRRWQYLLFFVAFIMAPSALVAQNATSPEQVKLRLSGYEWELDPKAFVGIPGMDDALIQMVQSTEALPNFYRLRALEALRLFSTERAGTFLEEYLANRPTAARTRRAFNSLATAFSSTDPERVLRAAQRLTFHPDRHVRAAVVRQLNQIDTPVARQLLRKFEKQ